MSNRVIRIADIAPSLPPLHYDLQSRRILNDAEVGWFKISHVTLQPTGHSDTHMHKGAEQLYLVLKGEMGVNIEGRELRVKPGEAVLVKPDEKHRNYNVFPGETDYVVVTGNVPSAAERRQ